jgi:glycerophosphoryl diester phosphodiesterase
MFRRRGSSLIADGNLLSSRLFDQNSFYRAFQDDLKGARTRVIIESPFITERRVRSLLPILTALTKRGVKLVIDTKHPAECEGDLRLQAEQGIAHLQQAGVTVLFTGGHHRKLAIIDDRILWEGSLNILSQNISCEIMRRMHSEQLVNQMLAFLKLDLFIR